MSYIKQIMNSTYLYQNIRDKNNIKRIPNIFGHKNKQTDIKDKHNKKLIKIHLINKRIKLQKILANRPNNGDNNNKPRAIFTSSDINIKRRNIIKVENIKNKKNRLHPLQTQIPVQLNRPILKLKNLVLSKIITSKR